MKLTMLSKAPKPAFLALILSAAVASLAAQTPVAVPGNTTVGKSAAPITVTLTMTASGTAAAPRALTQGISGLDFQLAPGGTCAAGVTYQAGQQCTASVIFTPKYPGQRNGAVVLTSVTGTLLGSTLLQATANGSLSVLVPGEINTVAGDGDWIFRGDGVLATQAPIFLPTSVVADAAGNLFLSDSNNNRVRRVDFVTGIITTVAGNGTPGFSGDLGIATSAEVSTPAGLAIDGAGNLYFADTGNHAIRRVDAITGIITTIAGTGGVQGYSGDKSLATAARLSLPQGIAFDAAGNLFIADTGNNVIRRVDAVTGIITTVAGTGQPGYNADNIAATSALLDSPWNLTVGPDGSLYIADLSNNRIRKVSPAGIITTIAGMGNRGFTGDTGAATAAQLNAPAAVILDPAGNLYIADSGNNRIREITATTGIISTLAGTDSEQFFGDTGPANVASMYGPYALFFDQAGNLLVADMFHNRVREISGATIALQYDTIRVGKTSPPQIEGVVNDGNASLTLAAPTFLNAALDPATTTCNTGAVLTIDATCNLGVEFAPTSLGTLVLGTLAVNSDAGNAPNLINLSGQVLSVNPTTVSLTSSVNPSSIAAPVTFTAVIGSGGASPTGPVTFLDGNVSLCVTQLDANSTATCTTYALALGQHSITASYAGDSGDAASVSPVLLQVVKQPATIALVVAPNPAVVTSSITLTATATAATGTPTGAITFYDSSTAIGSANLNASGIATFSTTQLTAATHNLSAQYAGDTNDAAAQSNVVAEVIQQATTLTTIGTSNASAVVGTTLTFTASVISTNGPPPTGTVAFSDGKNALGSGTLNASGIATIAVSSLTPGQHTITATYSGDASNATSVSTVLAQTILQIPTVTTLASSLNPASAGAAVQLTANVTVAAGYTAVGSLNAKVTFTNGSTNLGSAAIDGNGNATITLTTIPVGQNTIIATYQGATNYAASASTSMPQSITATTTTTTLVSSNPTAYSGVATTFTATVSSPTGTPTGAVNFFYAGASVGSGSLNAQGVATLTLATLPTGSKSMIATYAGDSSYTTSSSAPLAQTISQASDTLTLTGPASPLNPGVAVNLTGVLSGPGATPTGALTLLDGTTAIATQIASPSGAYAFSTSTLAVGTHTLTVAYAGDTNNAATTSAIFTVTIQQAATTTSLATSVNPQIVGQPVTLNAAVTSASPSLTGSISFMDGATVLSSVPLNANGGATYTTSALTFGTHTITAVYSGDTNHATSTSPAVSQQIVQAATAAIASSTNPSVAGATITFTAKLAGVGSLIPTGSVTISDGATTLGIVALDATGAASLQNTTLAVGSHTITVAYPGDKNYAAATASLLQTVQDANTQIALTASASPATYGTPLALVAAITSNGGIATGSVTFTDGGVSIGSGVIDSTGTASLTVSTLQPGTHIIVATYTGDGRAAASTSTPLTVIVKQLTQATLASSANPAPTLAPITLTATVTNSGIGTTTGTVTFTDGATLLGTSTLNATGTATLTVPQLAAGNHQLQAAYAGDATDFASTSTALVQAVQLRPTTTTLTASQTDPNNGMQVTLIAVERFTGTVAPTGTVTFATGTSVIGTMPVDATGVATLTIVLQSASESITASYAGDASYTSSTSPAVTITGGQATQFTMQLSPSSVSMASGQHTVVTLTIGSVQSFADVLALGCNGLPTSATCTFSTDQSALNANGTATVQLTIDTGNPLGSGASSSSNVKLSGMLFGFLPLGLLTGVVLVRKRRLSLRGITTLALIVVAISATLATTGCAGLNINSTPAGTYTFKVTAVGQKTGVAQYAPMTLTVTQ